MKTSSCAVALLIGASTAPAAAGVLLDFDLNGFYNQQISTTQYQTGNQLVWGASMHGWTHSGFNAIHGFRHTPTDYAVMIYGNNQLTMTTGFAANDVGVTYYVALDLGATVYTTPSQATAAGDAVRINLLNSANQVVATSDFAPGAWTGTQTFTRRAFSYVGDGSGLVRLQITNSAPSSPRFAGAVDNIAFWSTDPVPAPGAIALLGLAGLAGSRRRR
jgi:MYXO-CTERM domain-containing protein